MFRNPSADVLVVLVIVLLFFGPKRLPGLGRSLGSGIREFKDSITGGSSHDDDEEDDRPALEAGSASEPGSVAGPASAGERAPVTSAGERAPVTPAGERAPVTPAGDRPDRAGGEPGTGPDRR